MCYCTLECFVNDALIASPNLHFPGNDELLYNAQPSRPICPHNLDERSENTGHW